MTYLRIKRTCSNCGCKHDRRKCPECGCSLTRGQTARVSQPSEPDTSGNYRHKNSTGVNNG